MHVATVCFMNMATVCFMLQCCNAANLIWHVCRKQKPVREVEALLQQEEDLQKTEELANADAEAAEVAADLKKDACDIRAAPSLDLCSTEEMMQVFTEYYEGDVNDMAKSSINNTSIQASVDVKAAEFDLDYIGNTDKVELPDLDFGNSDASAWDVEDLLMTT